MIKFRMFGIHIDQFAILSKSAPLEDLGLGVNINYKYANKGRIISCSTEFNFLNSAQEKIMILAITCEFEIEENDYKNIHKNEKTIIPKELLEYFAVHTIGTARGILFCKTESTPYNNIIIPPLNVSEMIKDDMVIF